MMEPSSKGKVRNIYDLGGELLLVASDRVSAFDSVLPCTIPDKGKILNKLSAFWFDFTEHIIQNHMITIDNAEMPEKFQTPEFEGRCMKVKKLKMLPIECIVRGYIVGSGWDSYVKDGTVCGIELPEGLQKAEKLEVPIYTPTTKAESGHDEHISYEDTVDMIGEELAELVKAKSIEIYTICADYARKMGIIIADTKFEFGVDEDGNLVLADEVLTPDSSRFWSVDEYQIGEDQKSFDKQYLRDWLNASGWDKNPPAPEIPADVLEITSAKYVKAFEALTGTKW